MFIQRFQRFSGSRPISDAFASPSFNNDDTAVASCASRHTIVNSRNACRYGVNAAEHRIDICIELQSSQATHKCLSDILEEEET